MRRVAAVTFTRKAAGELKLRLREQLLEQAARKDLTPLRAPRLQHAVEILDNALISTVHSFADRLLRLRPADAKVSPAYEIAEDTSELVEETYRWLLETAERPGLAETLGTADLRARVQEASETVNTYQSAGMRVRTEELEWTALSGLDAFVEDIIESRDRPLTDPGLAEPDLEEVRRCVDELQRTVGDLTASSKGTRTLQRLARQALGIITTTDPAEALRRAVAWKRNCDRLKDLTKKEDFPDDAVGWEAKRWIAQGTRGARATKEDRPAVPSRSRWWRR